MANEQHVALLAQGIDVWNRWRSENVDIRPDLSFADLRERNLSGVDLSGADVHRADFRRADLRKADFRGAFLSKVSLVRADLRGANLGLTDLRGADLNLADLGETSLRKAKLVGADLSRADLIGADLRGADLSETSLLDANLIKARLGGATLRRANLTGTYLRHADLTGADVTGVVYRENFMRGKYLGIQGIEACHGDAIFRRDAADQDFLDTLEERWRGTWRATFFWWWGLFNYGRSLTAVAVSALPVTLFFAAVYALWPQMLDYSNSAQTWFTPVYYSVVTYTTLGFGDVTPRTLAGEILVTLEVIFGYVTLGLLLAILSQKVARRS
jgi:uncharacterized protein YjbI with pentapeptide repeats